ALVALAERPMGLVAIPLFLVPLFLTQFAVRRQSSIRRTYRQTIRTLSRLTELGGYTEVGHASRVAALSMSMGHELGMSEREMLDLEYAALLHDIGQVSLTEPIPGGATVLAAPADQRRIAHDGAEIVRQTGVLDKVAVILEAQTTPFRQVREFGEDLPLSSRIIKVCNAYDDLAGDSPDSPKRAAAIERIHLGLGYEYDPRVVSALVRALARSDH
ncbi:MAG TPA: HD domain-containing phosphohydrolase, partial [Dermatophilaceae bacterium]